MAPNYINGELPANPLNILAFLSIDKHETAKVIVAARTGNPLPQGSPVVKIWALCELEAKRRQHEALQGGSGTRSVATIRALLGLRLKLTTANRKVMLYQCIISYEYSEFQIILLKRGVLAAGQYPL